MSLHRGKSVKQLILERLEGNNVYKRKSTQDHLLQNKIQESAEVVNQEAEDRDSNPRSEVNKVKAQHMPNLRPKRSLATHVISNGINAKQPTPNKVMTPTILQKLNPTQGKRKKAYYDVAKAQSTMAKTEVEIDMELSSVKNEAARGFSKTPTSISNLFH